MSVLIVRSTVKDESVAEVDAAARRLFDALWREQPQAIRYASCRLSDGVTYVALLEIEDGAQNPLPGLAEFREFQAGLKAWVAEPPIPDQATVIGSYRLFDDSE